MGPRPQVVVIGAGFGGLAAARALRAGAVDVTIVDANNFHTFQPLLYQVATAGLGADDIAHAVRGIFRRQPNVTFRMARVGSIDLERRLVHTDRGEPLGYDQLVIAAGAVSSTFGVPGVAEHAIGLKNLDDALEIRATVLDRFERAVAAGGNPPEGLLTIAICGGGPTGVELAGGLIELFTMVLARDAGDLAVGQARVVLIEAAERLLSPFHPVSSDRARATLTRRGVEVITGAGVERIEPGVVVLADGRRIEASTIVWAAGVEASPLAQALPVERVGGGRLVVEPDLSIPGHPEVFAVGDIAASRGGDDAGRVLPQVAQPAIQGGKHAAAQILRRLAGLPTEAFRYHDKGSMATIGRHEAIAEFPNGWRLHGPLGWFAWLGLHLLYLIGFRNRATVVVNWAWNYLTYDRGSRILGEAERNRRTHDSA